MKTKFASLDFIKSVYFIGSPGICQPALVSKNSQPTRASQLPTNRRCTIFVLGLKGVFEFAKSKLRSVCEIYLLENMFVAVKLKQFQN